MFYVSSVFSHHTTPLLCSGSLGLKESMRRAASAKSARNMPWQAPGRSMPKSLENLRSMALEILMKTPYLKKKTYIYILFYIYIYLYTNMYIWCFIFCMERYSLETYNVEADVFC